MDGRRRKRPSVADAAISAPEPVHHEDGQKTETKRYRGVWETNSGKWSARVSLGSFKTAEEAAMAYDRAALNHWGRQAKLNFPERFSNSEALLNPKQELHIGPVALGIPVAWNFNNFGAEMSSHALINPTTHYGHMDQHTSNISQQVNPSGVSPGTSTRPLASTCYEGAHPSPPTQLHRQQDEAGSIGGRNTPQLAEPNEDLQTFLSKLVADFIRWEESEQSSAQKQDEAGQISSRNTSRLAELNQDPQNLTLDNFTMLEEYEHSSPQPHVGDPTLGTDQPTNVNDTSSDQDLEEFVNSLLLDNPL